MACVDWKLQYLNTFPWIADNCWYVAWYCYCHKSQYSELAAEVQKGRGRIPVADYKIVKSVGEKGAEELDIAEQSRSCYSFCMCPGGQVSHTSSFNQCTPTSRVTYCVLEFYCLIQFETCTQVVLTSTDPSELCINGMSFSRRASKWANSALVVTVSSHDFKPFQSHGPLAGVEFQVLVAGILCDNNRTTQITNLCNV